MKSKKAAPPTVGMTELCKIVNREAGTIRKWQSEGLLPDHLVPRRDENNHRVWTHAQVYGSRGIIKWMERNDMRPGKLMTDPDKEDQHLHNLRRPKLLNGDQIRGVKKMVENGRSREYIVDKLFPRSGYATKHGLEVALTKYFKRNNWPFPAKKRKPYPPPHLRMGQPGPKPKKGTTAYKRQQKLKRRQISNK